MLNFILITFSILIVQIKLDPSKKDFIEYAMKRSLLIILKLKNWKCLSVAHRNWISLNWKNQLNMLMVTQKTVR